MISCVILTKNEEDTIKDCIKSVLWCDEVVVIDDESSDNTLGVVKDFKIDKIKIYSNKMKGFSSQRNFALEKVNSDWAIFIDADERVSDNLAFEIQNLDKNGVVGYSLARRDVFNNKKLLYGEAGTMRLVRFGRKDAGKWTGAVHEVWELEGKIGSLNGELLHYSHGTVAQFISSINKYSSLRAEELNASGFRTTIFEIVSYPVLKFVVNYFFKLGFLDGVEGFIYGIMMSSHSFFVRSKLYLLQNAKNS